MRIKYLVFYTFYKIELGCIGCFKAYYFYSHYLSCGRIFKYMRLENSVKAVYFITYILKMLFLIIVVVCFSVGAFEFLDKVYQVDALKKLA